MKIKMFLPVAAAALLAYHGNSAFALTVPVAQDTSSTKPGALTKAAGTATFLPVSSTQDALLKLISRT